jgi:hypothetical protein
MKKYSGYFYTMMILSLFLAFLGYAFIRCQAYGASAVMFSLGFVFWFAGAMAPNNEKYRS